MTCKTKQNKLQIFTRKPLEHTHLPYLSLGVVLPLCEDNGGDFACNVDLMDEKPVFSRSFCPLKISFIQQSITTFQP